MAKVIKGGAFEDEVIKSAVPVLVDVFAEWCMPCKMIAPVIDEIAAEAEGKAKVVKIDSDDPEAAGLVRKYNIRGVPTLLFFKGGEVADRVVGALPKAAILEKLDKLV